jgi:hypothetical protein
MCETDVRGYTNEECRALRMARLSCDIVFALIMMNVEVVSLVKTHTSNGEEVRSTVVVSTGLELT